MSPRSEPTEVTWDAEGPDRQIWATVPARRVREPLS